jgi:hypothetical protein
MRTNHLFGLDNDFLATFTPTGLLILLYLHVIEEVVIWLFLLKAGHVRATFPAVLDFEVCREWGTD